MPRAPLKNPPAFSERLRGLAVAAPAVGFLSSTLLAFNAAQTASLAVMPVSRHAFRKFNRWAADLWWGWCVSGAKTLYGTNIVLTGDELPPRESAVVVANHQQMPDITFLMFLARAKGRLGDMKWLVKDPIKYVPGVGWGMWFIDCVFLKRNWAEDKESIDATFARIMRDRVPLWLMSFPEGTRFTPAKAEKSRAHALKTGLTPLRHLLLPRTKGFAASVQGLLGHIDAVYDITIGYEDGVPTLSQYVRGFARKAHLHVRRYPAAELPTGSEELSRWLHERYREKDELLEHFYREGRFPTGR
jgi:1-acyl-sn-glycerol-3-phosphate acyltransferase